MLSEVRSSAALPTFVLSVEPRVQPILIANMLPVLSQAHRGKPFASKGDASKQMATRAPGSSASTRVNHSVNWAFAMSAASVHAVVLVATLKQYDVVVAVKGDELNEPR